jgi:hypothetical protein
LSELAASLSPFRIIFLLRKERGADERERSEIIRKMEEN